MELEDLPFKIVIDRGSDSEVVGRVANVFLARALFGATIGLNADQKIFLCNGAHVMAKHPK